MTLLGKLKNKAQGFKPDQKSDDIGTETAVSKKTRTVKHDAVKKETVGPVGEPGKQPRASLGSSIVIGDLEPQEPATTSINTNGSVRSLGSFGFSALDDLAQAKQDAEDAALNVRDDADLDESTMTRAQKKDARAALGTLEHHGHLMVIKPKEMYMFHSDYYEIDNQVGTILSFFHNDDARDEFGAFWGVNRIPRNLPAGVSAVLFEQVERMKQSWIDDNLKNTDRLSKSEESDMAGGTNKSVRRKTIKRGLDLDEVIAELDDGASYLTVHNRLVLRAPSLEVLDTTIDQIRRAYIERLSRMTVVAHHGEQRQELSTLFAKNDKKRGKGFHFTSTEFAGSYSLVTNGLNDIAGEYVGDMRGDVNNSAVLFNVDAWDGHVVCADSTINNSPLLGHLRLRMVDMWGSKISQAALLGNNRVVHLVLNGAKLEDMGPKLESMTAHVDMTSGDLNMFELFGDVDNELHLYSTHINKIVFMTEQVLGDKTNELALVRGKLKELLTSFYVDMKMWSLNAAENRDKLRLVGIPHDQVPLLQVFVTYLDTEYTKLLNQKARDEEMFRAVNVLRLIYKDLLDSHGDLFNKPTADAIDSVNNARRVIYDFSGLLRRGHGVAMAQLVNVIGFAVETLRDGDVVIIHGADGITDFGVQEYLTQQFSYLYGREGRVVYLYNSPDDMLNTVGFNQFQRATYTALGPMGADAIDSYQHHLGSTIPPDLVRLVTAKGSGLTYLRRGSTNVVFMTDLALGVNPRAKQRREQETVRYKRTQGKKAASTAFSSAREVYRGGGTAHRGEGLDIVAIQSKAEHREERLDEKVARTMGELAKQEAKELAEKVGPRTLDEALAKYDAGIKR